MNWPPCVWNIPSLATGSYFFSDSHSNTHPLTPLHLATRIEAAERHWRAHWACRLTLAHPGMRLVEDHPSRLLSPGCLGQFMTPTRGDCTADTLESKWLSHGPAARLPASIQGFTCHCLLWKFLVTIFNVITMLRQSYCLAYILLLFALLITLSCKTIYATNTINKLTCVILQNFQNFCKMCIKRPLWFLASVTATKTIL